METEQKMWFRLDNAAKLYPAIRNRRWTAIYRISIKLDEIIDKVLMQQALDSTVGRMEVFACRLKAGLFWYYFEKNRERALITEDAVNPCIRLFTKDSNGYLFRVRTFDRRVSLEVFHSLSDGSGGITFIKTLVAEYLRLKGYDIPYTHGVLDCSENPCAEETEDAFLRYYNKKSVRSWKESKAYSIEGTEEQGYTLNIISGILSAQQVKAKAKSFGVSVTDFLVAAYMYALYDIQKQENPKKILPIKVSVPVNLRAFFKTNTLRNFSSYVNPEINANWGDYTFEEVLYTVHHCLKSEFTQKTLASKMSKNVKSEKYLLVRITPLPLKNQIINLVYSLAGESRITSTLSNVGIMDVSDEMAAHIERFDVMLGPPRLNKINCTACTYGDMLNICFSSTIKETDVERTFFTFLVKSGIHVKIESNRRV
jgi:NRPS condensation-like uncharacterized protein